jgi:PqqD family protein of HPr-rel-A system
MWRVRPGQRLAWRSWGDDSVLYNDLSGDTHLLDGATLQLLLALQAGAQPADEAEALADLLLQLERLALIERIPC